MTDLRAVWLLLSIALAGALLYLLAPVLTPFLIAALLAYIFNPPVTRLETWRVPRTASVLLLFLLLGGALTLTGVWIIPRVQQQLASFAGQLPGYLDGLQAWLKPWAETVFGAQAALLDFSAIKEQLLAHWQELGGAAGDVLTALTRSGMRMAGWLVNLVLVPVVAFYLLRDWNRIVARVPSLFPAKARSRLKTLARESDDVLGAFLRGQLSVMLALAIVYTGGLWVIGLDLALPIGLVAGLVSFVPYLGFIVGLLSAGVAALFQFQDTWMLVGVLLVFGSGQVLDAVFFTPNFVGGRIGLHPVAVIFAILAGGQLFGFFGVLLALPAAAVIVVWARHLHRGFATRAPRRPRRT